MRIHCHRKHSEFRECVSCEHWEPFSWVSTIFFIWLVIKRRLGKPSQGKAGQGMACMCAFISYSILLLLFIAAFLNTQYDQNESVYRTVTDVVLSCPKWLVFSRVQLQLACLLYIVCTQFGIHSSAMFFSVFSLLYCGGINFTFCLRHFSSLMCPFLFALFCLKSHSVFVLFMPKRV